MKLHVAAVVLIAACAAHLGLEGPAWAQSSASAPKSAASSAPKSAASSAPTVASTGAKPVATVAPPAPENAGPAAPPGGDDEEAPAALPPGHPPVGAADRPAAPPLPGVDPRFFRPPPDTANDDASLPPGAVVVRIEDAEGRPIRGAKVDVDVAQESVAKGEHHAAIARETDATGSVRFSDLTVSSTTKYRISVVRGAATFALPPFTLAERAGKRVVLHAYEASSSVESLPIALEIIAYLTFREDAIHVEEMIRVYNIGPVAWTPDVTFTLPQGFRGFEVIGASEAAVVDAVPRVGAALRGTFAPGRHDATLRYNVPLSGDTRQTVTIQLPPRVAHGSVMVESSRSMTVEVQDFPAARQSEGRDGRNLVSTERQATNLASPISSLVIHLAGLPGVGIERWISLFLTVIAALLGVVYLVRRPDGDRLDRQAREDLLEAREALLAELVALERARLKNEIGPQSYKGIRASLIDALSRILDKLAPSAKTHEAR